MCTGLDGKPWERAPAAKRSMTALANRLKFAKTRQIILLTHPREEKNMNLFPRKLLCATLFALVAASTPALSQDRGWYGGARFGQSEFKDSCAGLTGRAFDCEEKDTAVKLFGGYQFNKNFAAELGYADLGKTTLSITGFGNASIGAKGFELTGVGFLPVSQYFSFFGRLGVFHWDVDFKDGTRLVGSASASGTDLTYGFGASLSLARNAALRLEWQKYQDVGDTNSTGSGDITVIGFGLVLKF